MVVEGLLSLLQSLLSLLLTPINIPDLPANVSTLIAQALVYLQDGLGIFAAFTHYQYILALLAIVLVIDAAMLIYKFVCWVLKKIPMAGVE